MPVGDLQRAKPLRSSGWLQDPLYTRGVVRFVCAPGLDSFVSFSGLATQRSHARWSEIYGAKDNIRANDAYFKIYEEVMAEAEKKYKDRTVNS